MTRHKTFIFLLLIISIVIFFSKTTYAHTRTISFSEWRLVDLNSWETKATLPIKEFIKIYGSDSWTMDTAFFYAREHLKITLPSHSQEIETILISAIQIDDEFIFAWKTKYSQDISELPTIRINPFFEIAPSHMHMAKFIIENKKIEKIITPGKTLIKFSDLIINPQKITPAQKIFNFSTSGILHLFAGPDHLLFILALSILASNFRTLLKIVTAFTIAHALSLTPVILGWVGTDRKSIEALIGLSIMVVAIEAGINLFNKTQENWNQAGNIRMITAVVIILFAALSFFQVIPVKSTALLGLGIVVLSTVFLTHKQTLISWIHAFGFGLIHGLGISGIFSDRLVEKDIVFTLVGFNIGIELGQIVIAIIFLSAISLSVRSLIFVENRLCNPLKKWITLSELPMFIICTCLIMAGTYWFMIRSINL